MVNKHLINKALVILILLTGLSIFVSFFENIQTYINLIQINRVHMLTRNRFTLFFLYTAIIQLCCLCCSIILLLVLYFTKNFKTFKVILFMLVFILLIKSFGILFFSLLYFKQVFFLHTIELVTFVFTTGALYYSLLLLSQDQKRRSLSFLNISIICYIITMILYAYTRFYSISYRYKDIISHGSKSIILIMDYIINNMFIIVIIIAMVYILFKFIQHLYISYFIRKFLKYCTLICGLLIIGILIYTTTNYILTYFNSESRGYTTTQGYLFSWFINSVNVLIVIGSAYVPLYLKILIKREDKKSIERDEHFTYYQDNEYN